MNAQTKKDKDFSQRAALSALGLILDNHAETLNAIKEEAERIASGKAAKKEIDTDGAGLWGHVRQIAQACDEATAEHGNTALARFVFSAALEDVEGEAAATLKSYAATGGKLIEAVRAGRLSWATLPDEYNKVREAMKPDHKKELDALAKEIAKAVRGAKRNKSASVAKEHLTAILAMATEYERLAADSREKSKRNAEAARELEQLRQQHPAAPATVEVSAAA